MSVIAISEQGSRLTRRGNQLLVKKDNQIIYMTPGSGLHTILLFGRVEVGAAVIGFLLSRNIELIYLSLQGEFKGRLIAPFGKNVFIRQTQYEKLKDDTFRRQFASAVVRAKVYNYKRLVQKKAGVVYENFKVRAGHLERSLESPLTLDQIRGLEGSFSALYFRDLPAMVIESFGFTRRQKHPPPDPLNILLSFSYTLLFNNIYAQIEAAGLDPYCGFFHDLKYGHPALASDLMEEFRAPVADGLVIKLINRRLVGAGHFQQENGKWIFTREGVSLLLKAYRARVLERFSYQNRATCFLNLFREQTEHFMRVLKGDEKEYVGYKSG